MILADVIARVESNNNQYAVRFESGVFERLTTNLNDYLPMLGWIERVHSCSQATAIALASMSWGKYQMMGENLWPHLEDSFWTFGATPLLQDQAFGEFLARRGINYSLEEIQADPDKRYHFILHYNGPSAIDAYWARMQAAIAALSPDA